MQLGISLLGAIALVGSVVWNNGSSDNKLEEVTRRVERLEADRRGDPDRLSEILQRMVRVETKVDLLRTAKGEAR